MNRLFLLLPLVMLVSCGASLWRHPVDGLKADWAHGKTDFLLSLTPAELKATDLAVLGPGAAWNLGEVFSANHRWEEARLLWEKSLQNDPSPWRQEAGKSLYALFSGDRDWPQAERIARKMTADFGDQLWAQRLLFESLYFQKKDGPAQEIFDRWKPGDFSAAEEDENRLFSAVLAYRAGKTDEASQGLKALVFDSPASSLQYRLESFFQEDPSRYALLGPWGKETVAFQSLAYQAVPQLLMDWLAKNKMPPAFWNHRALVEDLETLFKTENRAETGLRLLEGFRARLTGQARFAAEYAKGRLYRALNRWSEARAAFQTARPLAVTDDDKQKTAWNWLNSWVELEPVSALAPFLQVYGESSDPGYFHDVFESWMTSLVQTRNWKLLSAAWRDLGTRLPPGDRATAGFVLARLAAGKFVSLEDLGITTTAEQLLGDAIAVDPFSYEAVMARAVLGQDLSWPPHAAKVDVDQTGRDKMILWTGLVNYGLGRRVTDEIYDSAGALDPEFVVQTVRTLQDLGLTRQSLLVIYRSLKDPGAVLTKELALLLYPRAYQELVQNRAAAEGLDPNLLFGLMREESSFDASAKSWVGAQGLTQLMPETAAETAKRLRIKKYDLANPQDNITLGASYLASMIRSQDQIFLALMAYNAGGGRIKPWKAELGRLPVEIFVEAAPISETRDYVKHILVSTVMYGVLHDGKSLGEMVKLVYPGFAP